jgi:SET domain-containing protein
MILSKKKFGDVYVAKSKIEGLGLFANRNFKIGELIIKWNPKIISRKEYEKMNKSEKKYVSLFGGTLKLMQEPERFVNFSKNYNSIPTEIGDVAIRDILKDEEITSNYDGEEEFSFLDKS